MKHRILLSTALAAGLGSMLLLLPGFDSSAQAQRNKSYVYDSGIVALGPDQMLIGMLIPEVQDNSDGSAVRSRKLTYSQTSCAGSLCKQAAVSDVSSSQLQLAIGEGVSETLPAAGSPTGARIVFTSSNPHLRGTAQIIDGVTGAVVSTFSFGASQTGL